MPKMPLVKLEREYMVDTRQVSVSVYIGQGQKGRSVVRLEGKQLKRASRIEDTPVGKGPQLVGKVLTVDSVVTDTNSMTNLTSVRYVLKGGAKDETYDLQLYATEEGGSVAYHAEFQFARDEP